MNKKSILKAKIKFEDFSMIYFLIKNDEIIYVGQTTKGVSRIYAHANIKDFDYYSYIKCKQSELNEMEAEYICKFEPKLNTGSLQPNSLFKTKRLLKEMFKLDGYKINKIIKLGRLKTYYGEYYKVKDFKEAFDSVAE